MFALIDEEDYNKINSFCWTPVCIGSYTYARRFIWEPKINKLQWFFMQYDVLGMQKSKEKIVTFKNFNGLDCRKENLLVGTRSQVSIHSRKKAGSLSGYKGVSRIIAGKNNLIYYRTQIPHCIIFKNAKTAAIWYDIISRELYGEFASNNNFLINDTTRKSALELSKTERRHFSDEFEKLLV